MVGLNVFSVRVAIEVCAGVVVEEASVALAFFRTWDLWARITFPRRFVGKLYFVTIRVWEVCLLVKFGFGLGFAVGVHCCPLWGNAVWKIGWWVGIEGSGAYCLWVRL